MASATTGTLSSALMTSRSRSGSRSGTSSTAAVAPGGGGSAAAYPACSTVRSRSSVLTEVG